MNIPNIKPKHADIFAQIGNDRPLTIIGGVIVLESKDLAFSVCEIFKITTEKLGMPFIFKQVLTRQIGRPLRHTGGRASKKD